MDSQSNPAHRSSLIAIFIPVFLAVFLVVVFTATIVTFILPEAYQAETRLKLMTRTESPSEQPYNPVLAATEAETVRSEVILGRVIEDLNLNTEWGRKYADGERLKTSESAAILKARLDVRPIPNTSILSIQVFSEDRDEAARIANTVARTYSESTTQLSPSTTVVLLDSASPPLRPQRPNKPLNIALGMTMGMVLGIGCAAFVTAMVANHRARKNREAKLPGGTGLNPLQ